MREGWERVALGEVFAVRSTRLGEHAQEPTVFSISKYDGVVPADEYFDKRVASANLDGYKVLLHDMWAYSTIHIDEGSIARNKTGVDGVVSPMYTLLTWTSSRHLPEYFELVLRSAEMLAAYRDNAQGSINRRRSLPWITFSSLVVNVPRRAEQRRIVDLIRALDEAIEAADAEFAATKASAAARRAVLMRQGVPTTANDAFEITMGRQRSPQHESGPEMVKYLRSANVLDGSLSLTDVKTMAFTPAEQGKFALQVGDVLVTEGSASPSAVGACAVWADELPRPVCFQNTLLRFRAREGVSLPRYVYEWCRWAFESGAFLEVASGTNIKHIGSTRAEKMRVYLATPADQELITLELAAFGEALDAASGLASSLREVRAELLSALLSGEHEIPASYDRFIEGVSAS